MREPCGFIYYARHFRSRDGRHPTAAGFVLTHHPSLSVITPPGDLGTFSIVLVTSSRDRAARVLRHSSVWSQVARLSPAARPWLAAGEPTTDVLPMAGIEDVRREYWAGGEPVVTGLVPVGDSYAATNPSLGRGATIGVLHACALRDALAGSWGSPRELVEAVARATQEQVSPWVEASVAFDRHRAAEMESDRLGMPYRPADPGWAMTTALTAGAARRPVARARLQPDRGPARRAGRGAVRAGRPAAPRPTPVRAALLPHRPHPSGPRAGPGRRTRPMSPPPIGASRYWSLARGGPSRGTAIGAERRGLRWVVSAGATLASTYLLDLVATASGLLLVASPLLDGAHTGGLWVVLAASYVVWGLGLRVNLRANLALLDRAGVSTNLLSKAAYDLATRRAAGRRATRLAAGSGYVLSELLKECPYYLGAFGAAALSDGVATGQAVTFLIGANLAAGLYEYVLAAATGGFLHRRRYAEFESDWDPSAYLREYYSRVEPDERETISFLVEAMRQAPRGRPVLVYGVGPTLHHVFLAAPLASELHLGEYLPRNREEVRRWLADVPGAHDWSPFVRQTLQCEGVPDPRPNEVADRERLTRARVTRLFPVDARRPPLDPELYPVVISAYCADSATSDRAEWVTFMHAILAHVEPGGLFATAALHRSRGYLVGGRFFPSADLRRADVRRVIDEAWGEGSACVEVRRLTDQPEHGYSGILLATAVRPERSGSEKRVVGGAA